MLVSDPRKHLSEEFASLVTDRFSFLLSEFGYVSIETCFPDLQLSHGDQCAVRFGNSNVGISIEIFLDFEIYWIDVLLFRSGGGLPTEHSVWGQTGFAPGILISTFIDWSTLPTFSQDLLPPSRPSMSYSEKQRRHKRRQAAVSIHMADVVQNVAQCLKDSAADILRGDTSKFTEIQAFYRKQQNATLSPDGRRVELAC